MTSQKNVQPPIAYRGEVIHLYAVDIARDLPRQPPSHLLGQLAGSS